MNQRQLIGLAGGALLLIGLFLPAVYVPDRGTSSFFGSGSNLKANLVLLLAIGSFVLVLKEKYKWLAIAGVISLAVVIYCFFDYLSLVRLINSGERLLQGLGARGRGLSSMGFGWAVLTIGSGLLLAAGLRPGTLKRLLDKGPNAGQDQQT